MMLSAELQMQQKSRDISGASFGERAHPWSIPLTLIYDSVCVYFKGVPFFSFISLDLQVWFLDTTLACMEKRECFGEGHTAFACALRFSFLFLSRTYMLGAFFCSILFSVPGKRLDGGICFCTSCFTCFSLFFLGKGR